MPNINNIIHQLYPSITVNRTPPKNIQPGDEIFFKHEYEKTFPPVYLYELNNVNVSPEGIVFRNFEVFLPSLLNISRKAYYNWKYLLKVYFKKRIKLKKTETYLLAFDEWSNGYFHWICDVLPKLVASKELLKNVTILVPEVINDTFYFETLNTFDVQNIIKIPQNSYLSVPKLIFMENIAPSGNYNSEIMISLQNHLLNYFKLSNDINIKSFERIYISRKNAIAKYIINENEVIKITEKYGFKTIYFEEYSLSQKIAIMENCKAVIGMHGANLTNILFMKPDGSLLELRKKGDGNNNAYYLLAVCLDLNYYYQQCEFENRHYEHPNRFDLFVDIRKLEENINKMNK